ncbi:hypothetical protein AB3329_00760 [Streptococcus sp. H31]|uniref:hypothetical protein n=1 Tax=Streptococcus huangxiaojuni TaxID=3237239 RepID=UPI0034A4C22D
MITLQIDKEWNGDYTFTVSNTFESRSLSVPSYQVSDFGIQQAKNNIQFAFDLDDGISKVKQALGIY